MGCRFVIWKSTGGASGTEFVRFGWGSGGLGSGAVEDVDDPGAFVARTVDEDHDEKPDDFPGADDGQLSRGGDDGRARDDEAADSFDCLAEGHVLAGAEVLVEAADR